MSISIWQIIIFCLICFFIFGNIPSLIKNASENLINIKKILKKK